MKKELHLIILWENARHQETKILKDIQKKFDIVETIEVEWKKENFKKNLSRFYGIKLSDTYGKKKEIGSDKFLLITLFDKKPKYDYVETSRGSELVNVNLFNAKQLYRSWTNNGHKVHTTNTPVETEHDLTLLLGKNTEDYLKLEKSWNKKITTYQNDLVGTNGWENLKEFFYVLNATTKYLVLRNYEYLPNKFVSKEHGDIDLLVEDFESITLLANAEKVFQEKNRVHCSSIINKEKILFDFRYQNDDYYCYNLEVDLLKNRIFHNGFYIPNETDYFYSLVYHALIHKHFIVDDYYEKLEKLLKKVHPEKVKELKNYENPFDLYLVLLRKFMLKNGYSFVRPEPSVYYDENIVNEVKVKNKLSELFDFSSIKTALINKKPGSGYLNFTAELKSKKVFIKWGGIENSAQKEYFSSKHLSSKYPNFFLKPIFYKHDGDLKLFVMEYCQAKTLTSILEKTINKYDTKKIINQLSEIANILNKEKLLHRDIRPDNILITKNSDVKLIDFQFVISKSNSIFYEPKQLLENHEIIFGLGDAYKKGTLHWDDAFSFLKIIKKIGETEENKKVYNKSCSSLKKLEGKLFLQYKLHSRNNSIKRRLLTSLEPKRKLIKLLCCFIPLKKLRHKLRGK